MGAQVIRLVTASLLWLAIYEEMLKANSEFSKSALVVVLDERWPL